MKLWIVVNHFLRNKKFTELEARFERAAVKAGVDYDIVTNMECMPEYSACGLHTGVIPDDGNPVLFWDKEIGRASCRERV